MIYFLYGEDSYRSKQKLGEIIDGYKKVHKSGLNLIYIDAKEKKFGDFYSNFKITSMFAEKKLIILKNVFENLKFQEEFTKEFKKIEEIKDIVVIYENDSVDKRGKFFKILEKAACLPAGMAKAQDFNFLQGAGLKNWIKKEFEKHGTKIDVMAENMFFDLCQKDLWKNAGDIKKLCDFKMGGVINREDVALHIRPKIENDIFKTIEALASKNKKLALTLFHKHLDNGDNALYILSMVAYQFRNLLILKELMEKNVPYGLIAKKSGLHPFVVQKTFYLCNQFSMPELKKIYNKIFQTDADIKIGKIEPEMAIDILVSEI
jgi:DNA polymerase-3 subunit delta